MESKGTNPDSHENLPTKGSNNSSKEQSTTKEVFINHAEISWHEMRRQWVGDPSQRSRRMPREPIMRGNVVEILEGLTRVPLISRIIIRTISLLLVMMDEWIGIGGEQTENHVKVEESKEVAKSIKAA